MARHSSALTMLPYGSELMGARSMSLEIPDTPDKAVDFVLVFLPGFLALGLVSYLTDLELSDFAFSYVAIALSILIHVCANGTYRGLRHLMRRQSPSNQGVSSKVAAVGLTSLLVSVVLILLYESQFVIGLVRGVAPSIVLKSSQRNPLVSLIAADTDGSLYRVDDRPADHRIAVGSGGQIERYNLFVRVMVEDNQVYEGRPIRFGTGKEGAGFPLVLSPACRVDVDSQKAERLGRIYGPGVLVTGHELKAIELMEARASKCYGCFYEDDQKKDQGCFDVKRIAASPARGGSR